MAEPKTYTEEEYNALSKQVEDLQAKVTELSAAAGDAELDARVAEARAELDEQVADLQSKLDTATLEAETAKKAHDDVIAYLEAEQQAAEEVAQFEAKKVERIEQVREVASFSDEYIDANADRWASMDDESFTASLEDWKAIATKAREAAGSTEEEGGDGEIPPETAMASGRTNKNDNKNDSLAPVREVMGLRLVGDSVKSI